MFWGCFLPSVFGSVYCTVLILFYTAWYLLNRIEANLCLADLSLLDCTWKLVMLNLYLVICDLVIEDLFICRLYLVMGEGSREIVLKTMDWKNKTTNKHWHMIPFVVVVKTFREVFYQTDGCTFCLTVYFKKSFIFIYSYLYK